MTGYGKSIVQLESGNLTIEIKSLNSKNLDLNTRITNSLQDMIDASNAWELVDNN